MITFSPLLHVARWLHFPVVSVILLLCPVFFSFQIFKIWLMFLDYSYISYISLIISSPPKIVSICSWSLLWRSIDEKGVKRKITVLLSHKVYVEASQAGSFPFVGLQTRYPALCSDIGTKSPSTTLTAITSLKSAFLSSWTEWWSMGIHTPSTQPMYYLIL